MADLQVDYVAKLLLVPPGVDDRQLFLSLKQHTKDNPNKPVFYRVREDPDNQGFLQLVFEEDWTIIRRLTGA